AVAQDDAPEVLRLQGDEAVEEADAEDEDEVEAAEEEDVQAGENRGHVEEAVPAAEGFDGPPQEDAAEDELLGQAGREEDDDRATEEPAEGIGRDPRSGPQDGVLEPAQRDPG